MGTPEFSVPTLEYLIKAQYEVLAVGSQPAQNARRGKKINFSIVEVFARKKSITVRTPKILDSDQEFNFMKELNPDI